MILMMRHSRSVEVHHDNIHRVLHNHHQLESEQNKDHASLKTPIPAPIATFAALATPAHILQRGHRQIYNNVVHR